nr:FtsK/SpoIIIE domain-containing protein [Gordonia sp. NB41Y]
MREADRIAAQARRDVAELSAQMAAVGDAIGGLLSGADAQWAERARAARADADAHRASAHADIDSAADRDSNRARGLLAAAVAELAPSAAGAGWSDDWSAVAATLPRYLRVGRFATSGGATDRDAGSVPEDVPALAPFLLSTGWYLKGDRSDTAALTQSALLRLAAMVPLRHLRFHVFDPRITGVTSGLAPLRSVSPGTLPTPLHSVGEFREVLAAVARQSTGNAELIASHHLGDLGTLWESEGLPTGDVAVIVVLDYPTGIDDVTHDLLVRLAETGPARGVSLLVVADPTGNAARGVKPKELARALTVLDHRTGHWAVPGLPAAVPVVDEGPPPASVVQPVLAEVIRRTSDTKGPVIGLGELIDRFVDDPWRETADDEIEAVIGRSGREPLTISLRSENPPHPNVLIGGAVGQGKSNLLLDIVYSLAARYGPDQLEMLLLDFKQGLEFKRFDRDENGENWLPHARILCLESNKAFGLAVLNFVNDEMVRRAELFTRTRTNGFSRYRATTGEPMRRMLLMIDEFQVLFDGHDDMTTEAVRLFENIVKQGRAFGIHVLLSSQTVSGISGFQVKGDSIFAQFPIRVSLKNTREESEAILSRHNTAAAELTYRGEVIVNRNLGMAADGANERGIAAYADPDLLTRVQSRLWRRAAEDGPVAEPWVFLGRSHAQWPQRVPAGHPGTSIGWLGRPLAVTDQPAVTDFDADGDSSVVLLGSGDDVAATVITSLVLTATSAWERGSRVVVLNGHPDSVTAPTGFLELLRPTIESRGHTLEIVERDQIVAALPDLVDVTTRVMVVGLGLHRVDLTTELGTDPVTYETTTAADLLKRITGGHGRSRASFIGWWPQLRALTDALGYDHAGVGTYVLLRVGIDDLRSVAGPHAIPPEGAPRIGVFHRNDDHGLLEVIPFGPVDPTITFEATR